MALVSVLIILIWVGACIASSGIVLGVSLLGWVIAYLSAEYNVRKLQALGVTVSPKQFPQIHKLGLEVAQRFGVEHPYRIIILEQAGVNALAVKFAKKHVIVLFSEAVEGMFNHPAQLRALLAHEMCHTALDQGWKQIFQLYKPAKFKQGRELTCDNAGCVAAGSVAETSTMLKKLCVGNRLFSVMSEAAAIEEARHIQSGLVGYFVKGKLSHPPIGTRLESVAAFGQAVGVPPAAATPATTAPHAAAPARATAASTLQSAGV